MADVFLSYASDDRSRVERLAQALSTSELSVSWDRNLVGGDQFAERIEQELACAKKVVVVWTSALISKPWVRDEASEAAHRGVLVPVLFDDALRW